MSELRNRKSLKVSQKETEKGEKKKGGTDMSVSKKVLSVGLAAVLAASMIPAVGVFAADKEYKKLKLIADID